jgi:hypothetical protein
MTDEQIEVAIAEAMGWEYCDGWNSPDGEENIPNFCTDSKAMFRAEKWLIETDDLSWENITEPVQRLLFGREQKQW